MSEWVTFTTNNNYIALYWLDIKGVDTDYSLKKTALLPHPLLARLCHLLVKMVSNTPRICVNMLKNVFWTPTVKFINFILEKSPSRLTISFKFNPGHGDTYHQTFWPINDTCFLGKTFGLVYYLYIQVLTTHLIFTIKVLFIKYYIMLTISHFLFMWAA